MTSSDTEKPDEPVVEAEEEKTIGPLPEAEVESQSERDQRSDHGSIYAGSSVSGFTNSGLPRRKIIHVETSTLYQLKSEVAKATKSVDEIKSKFGNFKAPQVSRKLLPEHLKRKRKEAKIIKNQGVDQRNERDAEQRAKDRATADKVKRKLEAKARIYDRVQQGEDMDDYMKENCLVDFDGKEIPERKKESERGRSRHTSYASENDMIDYTDALGRTSYIPKSDLALIRAKDREISDLNRREYDDRHSRYSDESRSPSPESKQARYQNIDDGDVRELGVGYYNFSADGSTREKQMEMLDTLRHSTVETRKEKQDKECQRAEKTRRMLEKKRKFLAKKRGCKEEEIEIPETDVVIDLPAPKPMDRTEMNIDRNIATAKKAARDWDKEKDMDEIYGEKRPVARETNYYETQRDRREDSFAPQYDTPTHTYKEQSQFDFNKQPYQRQKNYDNTFQKGGNDYNNQGYDNQGHLSNQYGSGSRGSYRGGGHGGHRHGDYDNSGYGGDQYDGGQNQNYGSFSANQGQYGQGNSSNYGTWN